MTILALFEAHKMIIKSRRTRDGVGTFTWARKAEKSFP